MKIIQIPCLQDNYSYLIICETTKKAGILDPTEYEPVYKTIQKYDIEPIAILNTHHHPDHIGGNIELLQHFPSLEVYGHHTDKGRIPGQTVFLNHEDVLSIGSLTGKVYFHPGHTLGSISYSFGNHLFVGDTLFSSGCGRLFEGTISQFFNSINHIETSFPNNTKIYCGHEYTESNLKFAKTVEPNNPNIKERIKEVKKLRSQNLPTIPTTLQIEIDCNPFLHTKQPEVIESCKNWNPTTKTTPKEIFSTLRKWKDHFKG